MTEHSEDSRRVFDETSLHEAIIKTWGEHGAHNDVFTSMRSLLRRQRAENERLRKALELACSDSHEDWRWAVGFYLDMAKRAQDDAALFGSSAGGEQ